MFKSCLFRDGGRLKLVNKLCDIKIRQNIQKLIQEFNQGNSKRNFEEFSRKIKISRKFEEKFREF